MLGFFRNLAATWPARLLFLALAAAFVVWGVSGKISMGGPDPTSVATVGDARVSAVSFQQQFHETMQRVTQQFPDPTQIPAFYRKQIADQTLQRLVTQQAIDNEAQRMGLVAPDKAVEASITAIPAFQGLTGKFDHDTYLQVLRQNNLTPAAFQDMTRLDIVKDQLLQAVVAGGAPSGTMAKLVYDYFNETRHADMVQVPFAGRTPPAPPVDTVLQRYYANNIAKYTAPEYRHIRMVILSPQTIGRSLPITDADMRTWYDGHKAEFSAPETRSLQVITVGTAQDAQKLAAQWKSGATWDTMQGTAKASGATATTLDNTTVQAIPAPELAQAAFAAPLNEVAGPIKEPLGFQLVRVNAITPAKNPTLADLQETVRDRIGSERAMDLIDARAQKLQDLFAGGNRIDEVPADIGAAGDQGTLDAQGNTRDGTPAPIPATGAARTKIIADAFAAKKGETTQFTEGPDHVWYAVQVDDITPAAPRPFASVRDKVLADWQTEQVHHDAEADAARLLATVKAGQSLAASAWGSGRQVIRSAPVTRTRTPPGVPGNLAPILFTLKVGEPTMLETPSGFMVATLADIVHPDPKADPDGMKQVHDGLARALRDVVVETYAHALLADAHVVPNEALVQQLSSQGD
jgi:peptidyl-prolyl cis-trans isomerase D